MKTMQPIPNPTPTDLTALSDVAIETFFADAGLVVTVVPHCHDAGCLACSDQEPAKAA